MWLIIFLFVAFLYAYMIGDFADGDLDGVNEFINETTKVSGYEWTDVEYKYIKL